MSNPILDKQKELFESDITEVAKFINDFAKNDRATKFLIHSLSSEETYDKEGIKYLIGLFYAGSVMCENEERTYISTLEEMLRLEKRLRAVYDSDEEKETIASDKLN